MSEHKRNGGSAMATLLLPVAQQNAVREQLDRILASSLFRSSKKFPDFLRYTVEEELNGNAADMKERTIGIEVFRRAALYDTNLDPVVRTTAVEVRKRLAQYYQAPGREHEIRIDFSRGSYVPEFRFPDRSAPVASALSASISPAPQAKAKFTFWRIATGLVIALAVVGAGLWAGASRQTPLDQFWNPVLSSPSPVTLCIPGLAPTFPTNLNTQASGAIVATVAPLPEPIRRDHVSFGDSMALSTMSGMFGSKGKGFRVLRTGDAKLDDLMQGPVVLIGWFSNKWTLQFDRELRFSMARDGQLRYISDRQNPGSRIWAISDSGADIEHLSVDYAIISRVFDATTGRLLVTLGGIHQFGTETAGRCASDPGCLQAAEKLAPGDWKHKNVQVVLRTSVIDGNPGQPQVLAANLW